MEKCKTLTEAKISSKADKMISDNRRVAKTFHDFFGEIDPILKSFLKENQELETGNDNDLISNYINRFKKNSSLKFIKQRKTEAKFNF